MSGYTLAFKPAIPPYGNHDPSAVLFEGHEVVFATEEERHTRQKHAVETFPERSIRACLDSRELHLSDVDRVLLPYDPELVAKRFGTDVRQKLRADNHPAVRFFDLFYQTQKHAKARFFPDDDVESKLRGIGEPVPPIIHREHHECHAASAFHPTTFDEAVVVTADGIGEYDSTVVWYGDQTGLQRARTYEYPNSLGHFYGVVTEYLGYRAFNGEGKVMGLAPYGTARPDIERRFREVADFGSDYDVTRVTGGGIDAGVELLEELLGRRRVEDPGKFDSFHEDVAYTVQALLEESMTAIVESHVAETGVRNVGLAGGVALNCKMSKRVMELDAVDQLFVQPVANDAGLALGAGWVDVAPNAVEPQEHVYWGPDPTDREVVDLFETNKISYEEKSDVARYTAERLADGALVGWMQGRQEMGARALGNRSILADPRTTASLDLVNEFVKHREKWRPFAPSMLESAAERYLVDGESAPFMIKTFDTVPDQREDIEAVVHPADKTTRPQTVRRDQNERYFRLLSEFESITGVPVLLNTSFNDHGEPIVTTPVEAVRDFYGMGLDVLVIGDYVVEK